MARPEVHLTNTQEPETISPEHLLRLLEISGRLSSTLRLDELLDLVMHVAIDLTGTEAASILLLDNRTGKMYFAASTNQVITDEIEVPLDNSIAGWVVRNGRYQILSDVQTDDRHFSGIDEELEFVTRSMLAVPLIAHDQVLGALEVINKIDGSTTYSQQDVALMEALASQSAVAIMNARLFSQSDLLAEIMHEVKTPLMAITTASELLVRTDLPEEKHDELIGMIRRESKRLSKMTRDFLDFARLESGRQSIAQNPVDIRMVVSDVVHISNPQASERNIVIETTLDSNLPTVESAPYVIGDSDRLKQVLLNLVSNAVKYNRENGRVYIKTRLETDELQIGVEDTGAGIEPQDIEHLFERFYRIPGSESAEGTGLGLSVAKTIVEQHNGRIVVDSVVGKGTTFTIHLPLSHHKK
ncbi:MAG: GAF domain-containing sensor histidine kinase [Chloroflexota bacterium]